MKIYQRLRAISSRHVLFTPVGLLAILAGVVVISYLLAGWMMRPIADDYGSLLAYHINHDWIRILPHTVISGGGRYGQTLLSVIAYGEFGTQGLKLTAFFSVSLFLTATYVAILAGQKVFSVARNHRIATLGALILFMLYTMISVTFPWIRGTVDNTFQDFFWLPGFVTYTLPFELVIIVTALITLYRDRCDGWRVLTAIGIFGIFAGTFAEMIPLSYLEILALVGLYRITTVRESHRLKVFLKQAVPYLILGFGLLVGLGLNYSSSATSQRRALFNEQASLPHLLNYSFHSTVHYFSLYVFGSGATDHFGLLFVLCTGVFLGFFLLERFKIERTGTLLKNALFVTLASFVMTVSSVYICFVVVFKGYGISSWTYLVPRFEIIYNVWFCLTLLAIGFSVATAASLLLKQRFPRAILIVSIVALIIFVGALPRFMNQTTNRVQTIAVFSASWQDQNTYFQQAAAEQLPRATVPVIDIGDAYNMHCSDPASNWLGALKETYYHIPIICGNN